MLRFWLLILMWIGAACGIAPRPARAHPMGNFSINHYARFVAKSDHLSLRTILDFAEIPTAERMPQLDPNGDQLISAAEKRAFLRSEIARIARGYAVQINGAKAPLKLQVPRLELRPGAGGLQTLRILADWKIALPPAQTLRVTFRDSNFEGRNGWMEIVARGGAGRRIANSNVGAQERSRELTRFPAGNAVVAPRQRQASFSLIKGGGAGRENVIAAAPESESAALANTQTPQNRFTQSIAAKQLTLGTWLGGLLAALAFGAVHALSPGHGKTMVAAYLVGSRGTPRHAVLLGFVVTVTHTLGVFALGFGLLFASQYVLPERLFPILSAASGLLIFGVGLWLFMSRYQDLKSGHSHGNHSHFHPVTPIADSTTLIADSAIPTVGSATSTANSSTVIVESATPIADSATAIVESSTAIADSTIAVEDANYAHSHGDHTHSHGGRAHSHAVPEGPITLKTLVALGISGGIVPCPEALVVLLAAVKLQRIGYGMLLILAFSLGLAAALIAIGLFVVAARERFSRSPGSKSAVLTRYLPLGSAAAITVIGIILTLQATTSGSP